MAYAAITARCDREDLRELARQGADELVRHFLERRSTDPEPDPRLKIADMQKPHYSLHSGRLRGATWYDPEDDIVWLVAAGMHRSGERSDAYPYVLDLESKGCLRPTEVDKTAARARRAAEQERASLLDVAHALRALRDAVLAVPEVGKLPYDGPDGLRAEVWAEEVVDEAATVRVRVRLRLRSGRFLADEHIAIIVRGPLGPTAQEIADDHEHRCFEDIIARP